MSMCLSLSCVVRPCRWALSHHCWSVWQKKPYGASACTSSVPPEGGSTTAALKSCWTGVPRPSYPTPITTYKTKIWSVPWSVEPFSLCIMFYNDCNPVCPVSSQQVLWWQKLLPELCNRTRAATDNGILLAALKGRDIFPEYHQSVKCAPVLCLWIQGQLSTQERDFDLTLITCRNV